MRLRSSLLIVPLLLLINGAGAVAATTANASGSGALALAALVAAYAPALTAAQKHEMASLLDGNLKAVASTAGRISVHADSVVCRAGNVDITARACTLTFGGKTVTVKGRLANELGATIGQVGVSSQGAAGTIWIGVTHLSCAIDPQAIHRKDGSGAACTYHQ